MKIFILHGWAYSTEKWEPFLKLLERNGIEYELLKIPGLTAPLDEVWALSDYVDWLHRTTKNQERITLLGHSNGGRIAIAYTLKYPEKVSQLILIDSAGIYHKELLLRIKRFTFGNLAKLKNFVNSEFLKKIFYRIVREKDYSQATPVMKKVLRNLTESDLTNNLEKINAKTTIIWGENDRTTPLSDGKLMKEKIKNSELFVIKNAGHSPQFSHPKEVVNMIFNNLTI